MNLITIDPGLGHTGIAFFIAEKFSHSFCIKRKGIDWIETLKFDFGEVFAVLDNHFLSAMNGVETQIWIESARPYYTPQGRKALLSGSPIKLATLTGALFGACVALTDLRSVNLITAPEWKGQLPDDVVKKRVAKYVPQLASKILCKKMKISIDEVCAIGIGKHILTGGL